MLPEEIEPLDDENGKILRFIEAFDGEIIEDEPEEKQDDIILPPF
jgi:hypothetical protein